MLTTATEYYHLKNNFMADCQITCVTKPNRLSQHEHITHVGNPANNWIWTRERVIQSIEMNENTFFVLDPISRKRSEVGVVRSPGKAAYLRTHADGYYNDNLLSLDQCPLR